MIKKRIFSALIAIALSANCLVISAGAENSSPDFMTDEEIESMIPVIENIDNYMITVSDCNSSLSELKENTSTDYGYQDLNLRENTEGKQQFYNDIAKKAEEFWDNGKDISATSSSAGDIYIMGMCVVDNYGLTFDEAASVYETFRSDNPLMYYLSTTFLGFVQNIHQINPHDSDGKQSDTEECQQYEHQGSPAFHGDTVEEIPDQEENSESHTDQKTADTEITNQKQREG